MSQMMTVPTQSRPSGAGPFQASYITHELRAPLTSINLTLEILREQLEDKLAPEERQILNIALSNSNRLAGLINDIMDFAKTQAGKMAVEKKTVDPVALIDEAVNGLKIWAGSKNIRLFCPCAGDFLPEVGADAKRVVQVLTNLISNAIKFTPEGGRIAVAAEHGRRENAGMVVFSVSDSGCGIAPQDFARVFECFEQSAARGIKTGEGTGLGLTLAKAMVEAHGGRIWVESAPGAGSTFYFTIPVAIARA